LEQWRGQAVPASDIYGLGATLHHLITGTSPSDAYGGTFNPVKLKELHGVFSPIRQVDKTLPKDLESIISKATAAEPEDRLTARQLKEQLEALISGGQEAALFTFKSGDSAKSVKDLVNLCEKYKKEAQGYLERGDFQRWFQLINRNDLLEAAENAARQGKSPKDRLERFLKLLAPNLALIRLRRTTFRLVRAATVVFLVVVITVGVIGAAGAMAAGSFIRQTVSSAGWNFNNLSLDEPNEFTKGQIDQNLQSLIGAYVDDVEADMRPPNHVDINVRWSGVDFRLPVAVELEAGKPNLSFSGIGNIPIPLVSSQISQGFNNGISDAFQNSPFDFTDLTVEQDKVVVLVEESSRSGRPTLPTATPLPTNTPTVTPTSPPTATPEGLALVTIFNETGREIILNLEGQVIEMDIDDSKAIEKKPGTYNYLVTYKDTEAVAAEGQKTWEVRTYRWRIGGTDE
jgi:serine/threonine protein kinase